MKILIIYDTNFGNTQKVAYLIGEELKPGNDVKVTSIAGIKPTDLAGINLLIMGSPINGWRPTEKIRNFLSTFKHNQLKDLNIATFDTRVKIFFHGDAAKTMAKSLKQVGAEQIVEPVGFFVKGSEGPVLDEELAKVKNWAHSIKEHYGRV